MPDVVSNELFDLNFPIRFQIAVIDIFYLAHQPVDILNQDIISRD